MRLPLTERQRAIVALVDEGVDVRDDIAEELGLSRNAVRKEIAVLCSRYGCSTYDLPAAVEKEEAAA